MTSSEGHGPSYKGKVRLTDFDERTIVQWGNPIAFDYMNTPSHRKQPVFEGVLGRRDPPSFRDLLSKAGPQWFYQKWHIPVVFYWLYAYIRLLETVVCTEWSITLITILNNFSSFILENKVSLTFMLHKSHQSWFFFPWQSLKFIYVNAQNIWQ